MPVHSHTNTKIPEGVRSLVEHSTIALTLVDAASPDHALVVANAPFLRMIGYQEDEVIGRNCRFLQPFGGAGPVRERIRSFLSDDDQETDKFVIPNVTRNGTPFLNLVYMTKLRSEGIAKLILGAKFPIARNDDGDAELYDKALNEDVRQLNLLTSERNCVVLGSYDALASSHALIAQMRME